MLLRDVRLFSFSVANLRSFIAQSVIQNSNFKKHSLQNRFEFRGYVISLDIENLTNIILYIRLHSGNSTVQNRKEKIKWFQTTCIYATSYELAFVSVTHTAMTTQ